MTTETAFIMDTSQIKFGFGATHEVGHDMYALGGKRVMVLTDPNLSNSERAKLYEKLANAPRYRNQRDNSKNPESISTQNFGTRSKKISWAMWRRKSR